MEMTNTGTIFVADTLILEEVARLVEDYEARWDIRLNRPEPEDGNVIYGTPRKADIDSGVTIFFPRSRMVKDSEKYNAVRVLERRPPFVNPRAGRITPVITKFYQRMYA